ncbi:MAG: radical SAM family heme chaperone HemW [Puniceicoccales bacterium]|jgi:oxygen-independent coproporphyrinogen-3 oxidase|nr:radical SAM family heme chaperone HemW [Puniceicoccales bacterium]
MNSQEKLYMPLGLYVHVPFCASHCDYCAFYKERPTPTSLKHYTHCLGLEIQNIDDRRAFRTVYIGGGTPGILGVEHIRRIGEQIHAKLHHKPVEWTVELSPSTVNEEKLEAWRSLGVNRISMGVQSFSERTLNLLGRKQKPQQVFRAYELIRKMGFKNVGLDLIFSVPGQTVEQFIDDLSTAISLQPEHLSTYCLTYEEGTRLTLRQGDGSDEDRDCDFYEKAHDFLESHGYTQYEISNYCRPGFASLHNRNTWLMADWIGVGPSASSQYGRHRYKNAPSLLQWVDAMENRRTVHRDITSLDDYSLATDQIIFGLRMNEGIDLTHNPHKVKLTSFFQELEAETLLIFNDQNIRLTAKGRLLCDAIAGEILAILE